MVLLYSVAFHGFIKGLKLVYTYIKGQRVKETERQVEKDLGKERNMIKYEITERKRKNVRKGKRKKQKIENMERQLKIKKRKVDYKIDIPQSPSRSVKRYIMQRNV